MNDKDYQEIGETMGAVIGCLFVLILVSLVFISILALPFILITLLTANPSMI